MQGLLSLARETDASRLIMESILVMPTLAHSSSMPFACYRPMSN